MSGQVFRQMVVVVLAMYATCCGETSYIYRLSGENYSPTASAFLFSVTADSRESLQSGRLESPISWLAIYDHEEKHVSRVEYPRDTVFYDSAWVPGQDAFVVTGSGRITLYRKDADGRFARTVLPCSPDSLYIRCSWSPKGRWLAVLSMGARVGKRGFRLGLYDSRNNRYVRSSVVMKPRPPVWKDDSTVYITTHRGVVEVLVDTPLQKPVIVRTIPLDKGVSRFYRMIGDSPLTRRDKRIQLGGKTLAELDLASDDRVATTETTIFISASSSHLIALDHHGCEVGRTNPGRIIELGPSGSDPDIVYGLTGSVLQYIRRGNATVDVKTICDLEEFSY